MPHNRRENLHNLQIFARFSLPENAKKLSQKTAFYGNSEQQRQQLFHTVDHMLRACVLQLLSVAKAERHADAVNAALLSVQMLAIEDEEAAARLAEKRKKDAAKVLAKDADISARF